MSFPHCRPIGLAFAVFGLHGLAMAAPPEDSGQFATVPGKNPLQAWQDSKFGMFVHWGVYAVPAGVHQDKPVRHLGEWIMYHRRIPKNEYAEYARRLAPNGYDAAAWVNLARQAGMKYMVVTAKHHDGFALFDSKVSGWDAVDATPAGKDLLKPIVEECRKQGMPLGFHYSQALDWWHAGGGKTGKPWDETQKGSFDDYLAKIAVPQIKELIANYGPVSNFFFDTPVGMNAQRAAAIEAVLAPGIRTNDRLYSGSMGSHLTYENRLPANPDSQRPWELCLSCNNTWGYKSGDSDWRSSGALLRILIDSVSKGGNVLLNVGPDAEGNIPAPAAKSLREIGGWLAGNGESIYSTRRSPYPRIPWNGGCTVRPLEDGNTALYLHLFDTAEHQNILLPGLTNPVLSAVFLGGGELNPVREGNSWRLHLPARPVQGIPVVKLVLKGSPVIESAATEPGRSGNVELTALTAQLSGPKLRLERQQDSPESNIGYWTNAADTIAWKIHLPRAGEYSMTWNLACDPSSAGAVIAITDGKSQELGRFEVPATGAWNAFKFVSGPNLKLPSGLTEIRLVPHSKPGLGVANLRAITLRPVD